MGEICDFWPSEKVIFTLFLRQFPPFNWHLNALQYIIFNDTNSLTQSTTEGTPRKIEAERERIISAIYPNMVSPLLSFFPFPGIHQHPCRAIRVVQVWSGLNFLNWTGGPGSRFRQLDVLNRTKGSRFGGTQNFENQFGPNVLFWRGTIQFYWYWHNLCYECDVPQKLLVNKAKQLMLFCTILAPSLGNFWTH